MVVTPAAALTRPRVNPIRSVQAAQGGANRFETQRIWPPEASLLCARPLEIQLRGQSLYLHMGKNEKKKILAVLEDLMFTVKINDIAKRIGLDVEFVKSDKDVLDKAKHKPMLIIIDLNSHAVQPLKLITELKGNEDTKGISLIGYVSHVQGELKQKAHDAGCDMVLARSAFSTNLPLILKRHAGHTF
jgi:PleD family two-component response regulator